MKHPLVLWRSLKIAVRLPLIIATVSAVIILALTSLNTWKMQGYLERDQIERLDGVLAAHKEELNTYLASITETLVTQAVAPDTVAALTTLNQQFAAFGPKATRTLQDLYITRNPFETGSKHKLDGAADGSAYSATHRAIHPYMRKIIEVNDFYDLFLITPNGDIVYTVFKELDYATNLRTGPWSKTGLADVFRAALKAGPNEKPKFSDFAPYAPSYDAPAAFIAHPVHKPDGTLLGVLAYQMPLNRLNAHIANRIGLGKTGQLMLVGSDSMIRAQLPLAPKAKLLATPIQTQAVKLALNGQTGTLRDRCFAGKECQFSYTPLHFLGTNWALLAEQSRGEIMADVHIAAITAYLLGLVGIGLMAVVATMIGRSIARPIQDVTGAMTALAQGKLDSETPRHPNEDEIAEMIAALAIFRQNAEEMQRQSDIIAARDEERSRMLETQQHANQEREAMLEQQMQHTQQQQARTVAMEQAIGVFEREVAAMLADVSQAARDLDTAAKVMIRVANDTRNRATASNEASQATAINVQMMATASEQLSQSISNIRQNIMQAGHISQQATTLSAQANEEIGSLAQAATLIGGVSKMINDIAAQTNLLALNATIEAARAGTAGLGFAVVASEVKTLAGQTATATSDIATQISAIQEATENAVKRIAEITQTVFTMSEISTSVGAAVGQQESSTREISTSARNAAQRTNDVSGHVAQVSNAAEEAALAAQNVERAAGVLDGGAKALATNIEQFLTAIKAA